MNGLSVVLTATQARNASLISAIAVRRGMPAHAATIALAAALQESKLYNLRGGDRDSLGLFQQRPSQGWGTPREILDPVHATNAFYDALDQVPGYAVDAGDRGRAARAALRLSLGVRRLRAGRASPGLGSHRLLPRRLRLPPEASSATPAPAARRAAALRRTLAPRSGRSR